MNFLLDTNIISEMVTAQPHENVSTWLENQDQEVLYLSAISIGEIQKGITKLPISKRRSHLETWLKDTLLPFFDLRILSFTRIEAFHWGKLKGEMELLGKPVSPIDAQIAATALVHDLILVTRNTHDFQYIPDLELFNPFA